MFIGDDGAQSHRDKKTDGSGDMLRSPPDAPLSDPVNSILRTQPLGLRDIAGEFYHMILAQR